MENQIPPVTVVIVTSLQPRNVGESLEEKNPPNLSLGIYAGNSQRDGHF